MAPKREQPAPVTPSTVANGLSAPETSQQLQALGQLANAASSFSHDEIVQSGIPGKLVALLQQPDKSVRLLACRLVAGYAASAAGPLHQAVASLESVQALWSMLSAYHASEAAVSAAMSDPAAAKAAAPKRQPGSQTADPDDWLPGPSKYLLDPAIRAICSLISPAGAQQQGVPAATGTDCCAAGQGGSSTSSAALHSWVKEQDVAVMVCLLRHASARIQMRAVRLAHQLTETSSWSDAFAAAGGVAASVHLATSSNPGVRLSVLRLLQCLADSSGLAAAAMVRDKQLMDALVAQLLEAGTAGPVSAQGKGKAAAPAAAQAAADAKLGVADPPTVQQAAADLLALLCSKSCSMSQQLVQAGGLRVLQALLPEPPAVVDPAASSCAGPTSNDGAARAGSPPRSPPQKASRPTPRTATPAGEAAAKQGTPRGTTPACAGDSSQRTTTPRGTPQPAGTPQPHDGDAAVLGTDSKEVTVPDGYPMPAGKVTLPELQAKLLRVVAAVLSHPGMVQSMLLLPLPAQASLPRLLLHMFAPAPAPPPAAAKDSSDAGQSGSDGAGQGAGGHAATGQGAKAGAAAVPGAKGATAAGGAAKGAAAVAGGARRTTKEQGSTGAAAGLVTPRKAGTSGPGGSAAAKEASKAAAEPPAPLPDPLAPPYSVITKTAALECLAHLTQEKQAVALLAEQEVGQPFASSGTAAAAAAQQQQQQHQQAGVSVSMLQHLLQDLLLLADVEDGKGMDAAAGGSSSDSSAPAQQPAKAADAPPGEQQQPKLATMLEGAAAMLAGLAENLDRQQLQELPMLPALKGLAQCGLTQQASLQAQQAVSRALLLLPEELYVAPARPPLPSPPATPPAPPLPTSQFAWDALDRPDITDGAVILTSSA